MTSGIGMDENPFDRFCTDGPAIAMFDIAPRLRHDIAMADRTTVKTVRMIAKTLFGLEPVLAEELAVLGAERVECLNRSVAFAGDRELLYRANMCCRTATRVLWPIAQFDAPDEKRLYARVRDIDWSRCLDPGMSLAIDALVSHSHLTNSLYVAQLAKDAIVDQFRDDTGQRPRVDLRNPDLRINLHIHENKAALALDASNEPLNRRGYRTDGGKAPLSEVLAAGILKLIDYDGSMPLVDPMCGSGTIAIEAALIARNIAPGVLRRMFGFMRWKDFDRSLFEQVRRDIMAAVRPEADCDIFGGDIDPKQIRLARANARRAGVETDIKFAATCMAELNPPAASGVVVMNPPYGERIKPAEIEALYKSIGDTLKQRYEGWRAYIFTGNLQAAKRIGLRTSRRTVLYNGPIESRLLVFDMYRGSKK